MWHSILFVAEERKLDAEKLKTFAMDNPNQYGIIVRNGEAEVHTWHVDKLVTDFVARFPDAKT